MKKLQCQLSQPGGFPGTLVMMRTLYAPGCIVLIFNISDLVNVDGIQVKYLLFNPILKYVVVHTLCQNIKRPLFLFSFSKYRKRALFRDVVLCTWKNRLVIQFHVLYVKRFNRS